MFRTRPKTPPRTKKKAKRARLDSSGLSGSVDNSSTSTIPGKDMMSGMPQEIVDQICQNLLPDTLPIIIENGGYSDGGMDLRNLMLVSRHVNLSATDTYWKNAVVNVSLRHEDKDYHRHKLTELRAFGFNWASVDERRLPNRVKNVGQDTLIGYLRKAQVVRLKIGSRSLEGIVRSLDIRAIGDREFRYHAEYLLETLNKSGALTKLIVEIGTDAQYMARLTGWKETKRLRWHLESLTALENSGVQLEIEMGNMDIRLPYLNEHIQKLKDRVGQVVNVN